MNFNYENLSHSIQSVPVFYTDVKENEQKTNTFIKEEINDLKRKHELIEQNKNEFEKDDEPMQKKNKIEEIEIPEYSIDEFETHLNKIKGKTAIDRLNDMASKLFQQVQLSSSTKTHELWLVTSKKVALFVSLSEGPFRSKAFHETAFENSEGGNYHYLDVFEADENDEVGDSILSISYTNSHSELLWIGKRLHLSGNEIGDLYLMFENTILNGLPNYTIYLYDDAKVKVLSEDSDSEAEEEEEEQSLDLKRSRIWTDSWYQKKLGFSIAKIEKCKLELQIEGKIIIEECTQNPIAYDEALEYVRTLSLSKFYQLFKKNRVETTKVISICKTIFGEDFNIKKTSKTLADLQKAVSERVMKDRNDKKAMGYQLFLTNVIFNPYFISEENKKGDESKRFTENLEIIDSTRVLSKTPIRILSKPTKKN